MTDNFNPATALRVAEDLITLVKSHFGYVERWHAVPMQRDTEAHWFLYHKGNNLCKSPAPFTAADIVKGKTYSSIVSAGVVLRKGDFVLIEEDTQCDGNQFLTLFSAKLECRDPELIALCEEYW